MHCTFRTRGKINLIVSEIEFTRAVHLPCSSSGTGEKFNDVIALSKQRWRRTCWRTPRECTHQRDAAAFVPVICVRAALRADAASAPGEAALRNYPRARCEEYCSSAGKFRRNTSRLLWKLLSTLGRGCVVVIARINGALLFLILGVV